MLQKTETKTKCDVRDCKNLAVCFIPSKGRPGRFYLCKDCVDALCKSVISARTPKSPKNTIKKIIDQKQQETV